MKRNDKLTTDFEPINNENVVNKAFRDEKLLKVNSQRSLLEKDYNEIKLEYNKEHVEEILFPRAVKTTIQILHDKRLFDNFQIFDNVLQEFSFTTRRTPDLSEQVNDVIQRVYQKIQFEKQSNIKYEITKTT